MVCDAGEKYFAPTLIGGIGADWHGCEQVCGIAGSDSGEKYFAPTLVVGGAYGLGWVGNRYAVVMACDTGEKYFAPTLVGGVGADGSGCEQGMRCYWLRFGRKIFRPYIGCCWG